MIKISCRKFYVFDAQQHCTEFQCYKNIDGKCSKGTHICNSFSLILVLQRVGVKVRNLKMEFNTGGTWHRVGQQTLIMKIYVFFIQLSRLVSVCNNINKKREDGRFLFTILLQIETK